MSAQRMTLRGRKSPVRLRLAGIIALLALPLGGCGTGDLWDKFTRKDDTFVEEPADKLYNEGLYLMNQRKDAKAASKKFEEVDRQHPYSDWARKSLLMSAYSFYSAGDYDSCIGAATRYVTLHPGSPDAAYAQYLIAMSYYQQIADVTRDQSITQQASDAFGELIRRYPETRYAADARLKLDLIKDHLGGKEMEIGRFYQRSGQWLAATYRFRSVVDQYQTTSHAPEALERLVECYLALGIPDEAWKAAAVLGKNYPETYWYRQSLRLLHKEQDHTGGRAFAAETGQAPAEPRGHKKN